MPERHQPVSITVSLILYRWLLRLGPDEFYAEYAGQAQQTFRQCCLDAHRKRGAAGVVRLWPAMIGDTITGMLAEQGNTLLRLPDPRLFWPLALALFCVLFPFFWLSNIWPLFGDLFRFIFSTPLAYFTGHVALFLLAGLSILCCLPAFRRHPHCYILLLMAGAFAEECIQFLLNSHPGIHKDARNLLLDLSGILLAYLLLRIWQSLHRPAPTYPSGTSG